MPAASQIQTSISIGGKLMASYGSTIKKAEFGMLSLMKSAQRTNSQLLNLGKGLLAGFGAYYSIHGIADFFSESIKMAKEAKGYEAALGATIASNNALRGVGLGVSQQQTQQIEKQAKALQEHTAIMKDVFIKGAAIESQYHFNSDMILKMNAGMADLLVHQRRLGKSGEELQGTFEGIVKAIQSGQVRGLKAAGIELSLDQQKLVQYYAKQGEYAKGLKVITDYIHQIYGGEADAYIKSLGGQAAITKIHFAEMRIEIGEKLLPVQQKLMILYGKFVDVLGPPLIKLCDFVAQRFDSWAKIIQQQALPVFQNWISRGWEGLSKAVKYFQDNSKWLIPFLTEAVKAFGGLIIITSVISWVNDLKVALIGLSLATPWTALALGFSWAAYEVITHWDQVKKWFVDFYEWIVGTKVLDPNNLGFGNVRRAFQPGEVPRAQLVQKGWLGALKDWWTPIDKWILDKNRELIDSIGQLLKDKSTGWWTTIQLGWSDLCNRLVAIWGGAIQGFQDKWTEFLKWLGITSSNTDTSRINRLDPYRPGGPLGPPLPAQPYGNVWLPPSGIPGIRTTHYGYERPGDPNWDPNSAAGKGAFAWVSRPGSLIPLYSASAIGGADKLSGVRPGQTFNWHGRTLRYDDKGATGVWRHGHYYKLPPTWDIYDPKKVLPDVSRAGRSSSGGGGGVVINYNVGGITIHGAGPEAEKRLAHIHREHIEQLKRDLAEVRYREARGSFVNRAAWS